MSNSAKAASSTDAALLTRAQQGDYAARNGLPSQFESLIDVQIESARPDSRRDYRDEVVSEVFRMIFDPAVARFDQDRGTASQYLLGLVRNAIRITDRMRRPVCVNRVMKPTADDVPHRRRDAAVVYDNTMRCRATPILDVAFEDEEEVKIATSITQDKIVICAIQMRFMGDMPIAAVAKQLGIDRFSLTRRLKRFYGDASRRLALAGAA